MGRTGRITLALCALTLLGYGGDYSSFASVETPLIPVDTTSGAVALENLPAGTSGTVVRNLEGGPALIVAKAIVTKSGGGRSAIAYADYDALVQSALPVPLVAPQNGDKVVFHPSGARGMIIAPSSERYTKIESAYPEMVWVHPDQAAGYLAKSHEPLPGRDEFATVCKKYNIEFLMLALPRGEAVIDCGSMTTLAVNSRTAAEGKTDPSLPFFHRTGEIKKSVFDFFGRDNIENFDTYYAHLFGVSQ